MAISVSGIFEAILGLFQILGYSASNNSNFKVTGDFFNPGPYAGFLVCVWSVALGVYFFKKKILSRLTHHSKGVQFLFEKSLQYLPMAALIAIVLVLPSTLSRASWIAVSVNILILLEIRFNFFALIFGKISLKKKFLTCFFLMGILSVILFLINNFKKESSEGRLFIWKVTGGIIKDYPFFGVGFDQFNSYYMNYQARYFKNDGETKEIFFADNTSYAFNEGLQFLTENGLFGLVLLTVMIYLLLKTKCDKVEVIIAKTGLITLASFAFFSYPLQILPIKLILILLLAILAKTSEYQISIKGLCKKNHLALKTGIVFISAFCLCSLGIYTKIIRDGYRSWGIALKYHQFEYYSNAIVKYESAYPLFNQDGMFLMNYGKTLYLDHQYSKAIIILLKAKHYLNNTTILIALGDSYKSIKMYDKAEICYKQAIYMVPGKFYTNYLLAKLYSDSGQGKKAVEMAEKILRKKIKVRSKAIIEIQYELKKILNKYQVKNTSF